MPYRARVVALYLPQFHPIPENDRWWGPGFTEWTNVAGARPLFPGHRQPNLPGSLGFYDLRLAEVRAAQAALAQAHGIEAFCYWHYWFGDGRQLLERPFEEVLASGSPDISFCLGWANESWSGVWHGAPERILIEQRYPDDDDSLHFAHLLTAFRDERYLRVGGRPVFHVYRPEQLPDASRFVQRWQDLAAEAGLPGMYLVAGLRDSYAARAPRATGSTPRSTSDFPSSTAHATSSEHASGTSCWGNPSSIRTPVNRWSGRSSGERTLAFSRAWSPTGTTRRGVVGGESSSRTRSPTTSVVTSGTPSSASPSVPEKSAFCG